jgi:hypothetical protein
MSRGARQVGAGQICRVHGEASRPSKSGILGIKLLYHDFTARHDLDHSSYLNPTAYFTHRTNRHHADARHARQRPNRRPQRRHRMVRLHRSPYPTVKSHS